MFVLKIFITLILYEIGVYFIPLFQPNDIVLIALCGAFVGLINSIAKLLAKFMYDSFHAVSVFIIYMILDIILVYISKQIWPEAYAIKSIFALPILGMAINISREAILGIFK